MSLSLINPKNNINNDDSKKKIARCLQSLTSCFVGPSSCSKGAKRMEATPNWGCLVNNLGGVEGWVLRSLEFIVRPDTQPALREGNVLILQSLRAVGPYTVKLQI